MINKRRISRVLIGIILLNLLLISGPFIAYASKSQTITFDTSMQQNRSQTITIPNLQSIDSISVDTGNVSYSINGEQVTITVSNGTATSSLYNSTKYSKFVLAFRTSSNNSFNSTYGYSDGSGYSGYLPKSMSSYVISGSYSPSDTKTVSDTRTGYDYGNSPSDVLSTYNPPSSINYNSGGYSGILSRSSVSRGSWEVGWSAFWRRLVTAHYSGPVTKPASDTRVWRQNYSGTVYKGGTDYYYSYTVTLQYTDNRVPKITNKMNDNIKLSENVGYNEINITGAIKDDDIGDILTVEYSILDSSNNPIPGHGNVIIESGIIADGSNQNFSDHAIIIDDTILEGDYTLKIAVEDGKGGRDEIDITFTIDKSGPSITANKKMVVPLGAYIDIDITATDSSNPLDDVPIDYRFTHGSFNGNGVHTVNTGRIYIHPDTDASMVEGEIINVDITAKDSLDNISTDIIKIKIDSTGVTLPSSL